MINSIFISPKELEYISSRESILVEKSGVDERMVVEMIKGTNPSPMNEVLSKLKLANNIVN